MQALIAIAILVLAIALSLARVGNTRPFAFNAVGGGAFAVGAEDFFGCSFGGVGCGVCGCGLMGWAGFDR
ncbi:MAG: hypothetical protein HC795_11205 [Coleofasciculaceae cyanobacterium RL_1_1]|nr:hypothetical protein [Coleofasciculaceae cyanobacterium RL_1_1]